MQTPVADLLNVCGQTFVSVWYGVSGPRAMSRVGSAWRRADVFSAIQLDTNSVKKLVWFRIGRASGALASLVSPMASRFHI